jgi:hypothetical protein
LAIDVLRELFDGAQACLVPRSRERLGEFDPTRRAKLPAEAIDQFARRQTFVPHVEMACLRELAHRFAVLLDACLDRTFPAICWESEVAAGDLDAGGHALDIPLPWAGQRLVEVVGAEDDFTVRRCEAAEVQDMGIAAGLNYDARSGRSCEIGSHDCGRSAIKGERRDEHAPVADRNELLHTRGSLGREHRDRIWSRRRWRPVAVSRAG